MRDDRSRSRSPQPQGTPNPSRDRSRTPVPRIRSASREERKLSRTDEARTQASGRPCPWGADCALGTGCFLHSGQGSSHGAHEAHGAPGPSAGAAQRRRRDASTVRRRRCSRRRRRRPVRGRRVTRRPVRADKRHGGPPARATRGGANHDARLPHPATENVEHRGGGTAGTGNQANSNHGRCRAFSIRWTQQTEEEAVARAALVASILARRTSTNGRSE